MILRSLLSLFLNKARAQDPCVLNLDGVSVESNESPFFEHYHELTLPVSALTKRPLQDVVIRTSIVDQGSYDIAGFAQFIHSTGLDASALKMHSHLVKIEKAQLQQIASGQSVEVKVISDNGNYVHNFIIKATASALVKSRKAGKV